MTKTVTYRIVHLSTELVYIRWQGNPNREECRVYIQELSAMLDSRDTGLYFLSDLRKGRIVDMGTIQKLTKLTQHKNWYGSVAFTTNPLSDIFASSYHNMLLSKKERNVILREADKAIAFLEGLQSGLTDNIDWQALLSS